MASADKKKQLKNQDSLADLQTIKGIQSDDSQAFDILFRKYYESLYQFAGRYVKAPQVAENIVQDVFVKIWEGRVTMSIKSNVRSYLYTAVKNHSLNYLKRDKRQVNTLDALHPAFIDKKTPEDHAITNEKSVAVRKAIDTLPERCRQIFLLKQYDGLSYADIADVLNISVNTVKTQLKRAVKLLTKQLSYWVSVFIAYYITEFFY